MGNAGVGPQFTHFGADGLRVHRAALLIDVHAIGLVSKNKHFRPQFPQDAGGRFVGRAMRAIDHDAQSFQGQAAWDRRFDELDVAPEGVVDADRLAHFAGGRTNRFNVSAEDKLFNPAFDVVIQFKAVRPEET